MTGLDALRNARIYLAGVYRDKAVALFVLIAQDPAGDHFGAIIACQDAWNALASAEKAIRAEVIAGDPIDDYYRLKENT